ncbi:glycosyltransferase [Propionivibrio dicarboxylicus]|uniref:Glycosyltransferase involved in cell wall bisynthesis n=1 Tax=Propionivibrio dicarboxylicus TaxID=83767 RepID=A0A1G8L0R6_9RHOO|nr:glycosyltransferase [Propionivibrio dicarboxylicus]SDI49325.1 Glycosyltransferase involved in cell wall bisynthesis [Propionivibrio dicarboxylicus]
MRLTQINLQPHFGGGEVYTAFLSRAFDRLGIATTLYAHPDAAFWHTLDLPTSLRIETVPDAKALVAALPRAPLWLLSHGPQFGELLAARDARWLITAMAHMPLQGRNPRSFDDHDMVFPVSEWVRSGLIAVGAPSWHSALYGLAALDPQRNNATATIVRTSRYDWDRRKFRDRLLGTLNPLVQPFIPPRPFTRRPGLTLGIVSRLTPIKQFPQLFDRLAPVLARFPSVNLEIFGSGGYASVRDLDAALKPIADRTRFWGQQRDVRAVYAQLDYLLTGLPEKEALGLNVIEAQACDLPVLAVKAPPFTETVCDGVTGYFYRDPREDGGEDFAHLIERLLTQDIRLHPATARDHLERFSFDAFVDRLRPIVAWAENRLAS